ncbi:MAG: PAS domain S-box protein [Planctomycetaceae bacterium]
MTDSEQDENPSTPTTAERVQQLEQALQFTRDAFRATQQELVESRRQLVESRQQLHSAIGELNRVRGERDTLPSDLQQTLQELQEKTDFILAATGEGICEFDSDSRLTFMNAAAARMLGREANEAVGKTVSEIFGFECRSVTELNAGDCAAADVSKEGFARRNPRDTLVRADGTSFPVELVVSPEYPSRSGQTGSIVVIRDTTETIRTHQEIERQQQRIRLIADSVPALVSYVGPDMRYRFVNKRYCEYFNLKREEIVGKHVRELVTLGAFDQAAPRIRRALAGETVHYELIVPRHDGTPFFASVTYTPEIVENTVLGVVAIVVDMTALKEAENRYERAAAGTGDGIFDWDIESPQFYGSPRFWLKLGQPDHDPMATLDEYFQGVHPEDLDNYRIQLQKLIAGEIESLEFEHRYFVTDNVCEWFLTRGRIGLDSTQRRRFFSGSIRKISDRKQLEIQLREELRKRDIFLAMLSHELRNPVNALMLAAQLGLTVNLSVTEMSECMETIDSQARLLRRLLDDLLDLSRLNYNKLNLRKSRFNVCRVVQDAISALQAKAESKSVALKVTAMNEGLFVDADRDRIMQCILNLITNAIKYTSAGGNVEVSLEADEGKLEISVADDGIGMSEQTLATAFEMFSQANSLAAGSEGGLGLGLALVSTICQLHGGTVTAESEGLGRGSTLRITLPGVVASFDDQMPSGSMVESTYSPIRPQIRRILLIDDLPTGRAMLARCLTANGFEVMEAETGENGIELARKNRPDVVIADIGLPDISGFDVARRLRQHPETRHLPLFALTGYGQESDLLKSKGAGFNLHLTKPVDLSAMLLALAGEYPDAP